MSQNEETDKIGDFVPLLPFPFIPFSLEKSRINGCKIINIRSGCKTHGLYNPRCGILEGIVHQDDTVLASTCDCCLQLSACLRLLP